MKILKTNDINYILGVIVSFYAAYVMHYNINLNIPKPFAIPGLALIIFLSNYNITLGLIVSVALIVSF